MNGGEGLCVNEVDYRLVSVRPREWMNLWQKMSECLRTYGPQIIRVPQLQIED